MNRDGDNVVWNSDQGYVGSKPEKRSRKGGKQRGGTAASGFPADGVTRVRREKGGRGGKTVTVLYGVPGRDDDRLLLLKDLKKTCGCGGAYKDGRIEIQGDHRDSILTLLGERGIVAKAAGG